MQAMFFFSLMGFFISIVTGITATVANSTMQVKQQRIEETYRRFADIEFALNDYILGQFTDLAAYSTSLNVTNILETGTFLTEYTGNNRVQMMEDPWQSDIYIRYAVQNNVIMAGGGNAVQAPVLAIAIISPGPDKVHQTPIPDEGALDYRGILNYEAELDTDDIIYTFSTYRASLDLWNEMHAVAQRIASLAEFNYKQKYEAYLPTIEAYYQTTGNFNAFYDPVTGDFILSEATINQWRTDLCCDTTTTPPYPTMPTSLAEIGADQEITALPAGVTLTMTQPGVTTAENASKVNITLAGTGQTAWDISFTIALDGRDIVN